MKRTNCLFDFFTCAANVEYGPRSAFPVKRKEYKTRSWLWKLGFYVNIKSQSGNSTWVPPICCVSVYDDTLYLWLWDSTTTTNMAPYYKWFRGNYAEPLSPLLTVKQRRGIGRCSPKREPCLCMGALYTSQTRFALKKPLLHILPDYPAPFIHQHRTINMVCPEVVHYCLTCEGLLLQTSCSLF